MAKGNKDLFHGQGNSTVGMPTRPKNKAGKTDPEQNNCGKLLKTVKKVQSGWSK